MSRSLVVGLTYIGTASTYTLVQQQDEANSANFRSTFTDGVGHCTQKVADECARIVGYSVTPVSAFQYRDGGVKGVACVVEDPTLGDFEVRERDSSVKFQSDVRELSVLKVRSLLLPLFSYSFQ